MFRQPYFKIIHTRIISVLIFVLLIPLLLLYNIYFLGSVNENLNTSQKSFLGSVNENINTSQKSFLGSVNEILKASQKSLISCYFEDKLSNSLLELNPHEVDKNSIFFIETSCNHKNGINLNLRQGCAIESAAHLNPNLNIFVLIVSPSFINNQSDVIKRLNMYSNVNFRHINFVKYSLNTPLQDFVTSNTIFTSLWPVSHTSDLLRFLTLWKFGGTYMDLDVVLMKSLEGITNFAGVESNTSVASLILNFGYDDIGKTIANITTNDFANNYQGNNWGYNGPGVITRALTKICNTEVITDFNKQNCKGFMVFGQEAFCPVKWMDWAQYFNSRTSATVMRSLENSMGIHVWNLLSKHTNIIVGSKQPYGLVAQKYCPDIFSLAKDVF